MFKVIAVLGVCGVGLMGQTTASPKDATVARQVGIQVGDGAEFGPIGITAAMAGPMATVAGAPYSAQAVTERVQTLGDGNRIVQSTSSDVARDSQGRVRRDEALPGLNGSNGDTPHLVMIEDPVAGVHWTLDPQTKTAIKMPFAKATKGVGPFALPPPGPEKTWFYSTSTSAASVNIQTIRKGPASSDSNVSKTDLGTQTVEGVTAQGTRTVRTIPAGAVGNEQPISIVTETWYSPDLKVLVMSKVDDPRMGETTYKLTNILRSEPAASLFQPPDDYTVKDQPTNIFFSQMPK